MNTDPKAGHRSPLPVFREKSARVIPSISGAELEAMLVEEELEKWTKIQTSHLADRWDCLCASVGLSGKSEWVEIMNHYGAPDRAYHNFGHIGDCLNQLDSHAKLAEDRVALEFAIWFHDVIYNSRASDNEARSAEVAARFLRETPICGTVLELILATHHETPASVGDQQLMADIDLSILGRSRGVYESYAEAIRHEYSWVAEDDYVKGRAKVLKGFYDRTWIFGLTDFREAYEEQARSNLLWELRQLGVWQLPKFDGGGLLVPLEQLKDLMADDETTRSLRPDGGD